MASWEKTRRAVSRPNSGGDLVAVPRPLEVGRPSRGCGLRVERGARRRHFEEGES
jgi:hypothetical protein